MGKSEDLAARPANIPQAEWAIRVELAALYHVFDYLGWIEMIFNHISARVPGPERHFLMNPYGLNYGEVTASNLVKVDLHGNNVEAGPYRGNPAGFAIHGAIHEHRDDAHCVIHTHTTTGMAIACKEGGLRHDDFNGAILTGKVAYHDFEGVTVRADERERIAASIGDKELLILRNHGLCATGRDIPRALFNYWRLQRACDIQALGASMAGADRVLSAEVRAQSIRDSSDFDGSGKTARMFFDALVRRMQRERNREYIDFRS